MFRVNQLFINLGIPSDHVSFLHKQCNKFDASPDITMPFLIKKIKNFTAIYCTNFLICVPSSFIGKIYTNRRSEHSPGVRFCKYLLVNLLMVGMSVSAILPLFSVLCPFQ